MFTDGNHKYIKGMLLKLSLIMGVAMLMVGCGGGSSGSGSTPDPETVEPISDEALAFEMMIMARSFNEASDPLFSDSDDPFAVIPFTTDATLHTNTLNLMREKTIQVARSAHEVSVQSTYIEPCESGNIVLTEISNGYSIIFNACQLRNSGITIRVNGSFTTVETGAEKGYAYGVLRNFQNLNIVGTGSTGDSLAFVMHGTINTYYNPDNARRAEANMRYDMSVACSNQQGYLNMAYNNAVFVVTPDTAGQAVTMNGNVQYTSNMLNTAPSSRFALTTLEAMRFTRQSTEPYDGRLNVTTSDRASTLQYVTGGVFVDGKSYSWEEILRVLGDYQTFDNFDANCNF